VIRPVTDEPMRATRSSSTCTLPATRKYSWISARDAGTTCSRFNSSASTFTCIGSRVAAVTGAGFAASRPQAASIESATQASTAPVRRRRSGQMLI